MFWRDAALLLMTIQIVSLVLLAEAKEMNGLRLKPDT
jgi:hypothetical protein